MMTEADIRLLIRREIMEVLAPILMGKIISNESNNRSTMRRMPSEAPLANLRNIQPYGVSSRAPAGTSCLTIPVAGDPTHINIAGHFDESRPTTKDGECILYDANGHIIYLSESKMQFGSKSSANPMMLGDIVLKLLSDLLELIANHRHVGNLGYQTSEPLTQMQFLQLKESPVDDEKIISNKCFTEK